MACKIKSCNIIIKNILVIIFLSIFIYNEMQIVCADETFKAITELSMSEIKNSDVDMEFITNEYEDETIECYAVGEENIAIGLTNHINIYDINGNFLYAIKYSISSSYFLEYVKTDLYLYSLRSSKCIKITGYKEPIFYYSVNDTKSNYDIISHKLKNVRSDITIGSVIYKVEGINSTKLVKTSNDNMETVIYNSTTKVGLKFIVVFIGVVIFAFVVLFNIISEKKKIPKTT